MHEQGVGAAQGGGAGGAGDGVGHRTESNYDSEAYAGVYRMNSSIDPDLQSERKRSKSPSQWWRWMILLGSVPFCIAGLAVSLGLNEQTYAFIKDSHVDLPSSAWRSYAMYRIIGWAVLFASLVQILLSGFCAREWIKNRANLEHLRKRWGGGGACRAICLGCTCHDLDQWHAAYGSIDPSCAFAGMKSWLA